MLREALAKINEERRGDCSSKNRSQKRESKLFLDLCGTQKMYVFGKICKRDLSVKQI